MHETADGRAELRAKGVLRDSRHYERFCCTPQELIERAELNTYDRLRTAERLYVSKRSQIPQLRETNRASRDMTLPMTLQIGYIDQEALTVDGRKLYEGDECPTGYTIALASGTGLPVGVDVLDASGNRIEGYSPPDGLVLTHHHKPVKKALGLECPKVDQYTLFVPGWFDLIHAPSDFRNRRIAGYQGDATVAFDIAESMIFRPVLVDSWAFEGELDPRTEAIVEIMADLGMPAPPAATWKEAFGRACEGSWRSGGATA